MNGRIELYDVYLYQEKVLRVVAEQRIRGFQWRIVDKKLNEERGQDEGDDSMRSVQVWVK